MTSMKLARGGGKRGFARHLMLGSTAVAALALAAPADATTYTVTDQASLIAAINAANASAGSDTIILANDISMSALMPVISDSLVIDGAGYALTNDQRLFFVDSAVATVDIANFSALTGSATGGAGGNQAGGGMGAGGAIFVNAGTVNVSNVSFDGNAATGGAGGAQASASDSPGGGGGGLGGAGGLGGSNVYSGAGGGGGFSGGGGGGGGMDNSETVYYSYVDLVSPSSSYSYTYAYTYTSTPGAGGAGLEGSGGNGAGQGAGSAGTAGGSGGFGGSAATSASTYVNQPTTTDSCYYSYGWWGGWVCYTDDAHTEYYSETGATASGGGGGGSGSGAGNGGDGSVSTASYSYSYTYYGYSYGSGTVASSGTYAYNQAGGGGGGGGGLGGGGGSGGSLSTPAADGGYGTGGGGAPGNYAYSGGAGDGGVFGGGGGAGYGGSAGDGGFGGGGGGGGYGSTGGAGGFGGGGGGGVYSSTVVGGFAGGQGGQDGGGGGAGLGGAIFANAGATLNIGGGVSFQGSSATGGAAGSNGSAYYPSTAGQGLGSDLFLMSGTTTGFNIASGQTAVLTGTIADDSANTLAGGTGSGATIAVRGGGTLDMEGQSTIGGGYVVDSSTLDVGSTGMIDATGSAVQLIGTGSLLDNAGTLYGDGTGVLANGIDATIVNRAGGVIGSGSGNAISVASGSAFISLDTGSTLNGSIDNSAGASVTARIGGQVNGGYIGGVGSDAVRVDASGHVTGDIDLGGGNDSFASAGTIDGTVDGGDGADTYYQIVDGTTANRNLTDLLAGTTNFERFGMAGDGTLVLSGAADASTPDLVAGAGVDEGMLVLDNTSGLTSDIYVNGAVLRVVGDGATGTGTIHMIDPTISFATNGTYANDFALEVASPASADPTVFQVDPGVSVILTGAIATGSAPGTDPTQYVTIDGSGVVTMTNSANSWTGTTTVNAGALLAGSSQSISGSSIVNNGTLYYIQGLVGGDDTVSQDISGNGAIVAQGLAGYSFTFAGSVAGSTLYSNGASLVLANDVSLTNGVFLSTGDQLALASGATLTAGGGTAIFGYGDNSIVNAGSIAGGVVMAGPTKSLTLDNQAGGVISATGSNAIAVQSYAIDGSNDGKIVGQWMGMVADGAMDFTNRGLIASGTLDSMGNLTLTGNDGVEILGGGTFTNAVGGQVLGNITGALTNTVAGASIINSGLISGNQYGSFAYIGTNLTNNAGGIISGGTYGVTFANAGTNALTNSGTIAGGNQAVANLGSGSATIVNSGDITGGVVSVGGGDLDVTNQASGNIVRVAYGSAIDMSNGGKLTLDNAGDIVGSQWGVVGRNAGDTIVNSGRIATGSFSGETITAGGETAVTLALGGTITNNATGQILGGTNGILTEADASITNHGLIEGQSGVWSNGIAVSGGTAIIDNDGMIVAHTSGNGIYVTSAATVTNNAGGQIIAAEDPLAWGVGFDLGATSGTVTNNGIISGGVGVFMGTNVVGGNVTNDGSITGLDIGVEMLASGQVANAGSISGGNAGITLASGGSVSNSGDIAATLGGYTAGIGVGGGDFTLSNDAGGSIVGDTWGLVYSSNGALTVTNAGSMFGGTFNAIYAGTGDGARIVNQGSGSLIGANAAIYADGANLSVDNAGLIRVTGGTQDSVVSGIYASQAGASVTNSGKIESSLGAGNGIRFDQGGSVINSGTIAGGASGIGIDLRSGGSVTNQSGGSISGGAAAILVGGAAAGSVDLKSGSTTGLVGSIGSGSRSVTVAGSLVGYDASTGTGVDTFSLASTGSTGSVKLGDGNDSFTTFGGAITGNVDGGAGTDSLTFDVAGNVTYGGNFTGFETGTKTGTGRVSLTGTNSLNTMLVNGGVLAVNGVLGSAVTVNAGGTLGGTGTINGSLLIASGGHLAPGNSIGTINVTGPVTFASGSTYDVEINPTTSDKLVATGAVTISGGTVNVIGAAGVYAPLTTYQIIQGASVTGTFTNVVDNLAFLDPTLTYTSNSVNLLMRRNDIAFAAMASNANQRAAANGAQSLGSGVLYDAVLVQDANGARQAYDSLAGAMHPSIAATLAQRDRLRVAQLDQAAAGGEGVALWADASAGVGNLDRTGNGAFGLKDDHHDLLAGVRYDRGPLSLVAGGGRVKTDIDQRDQQGSGDVGSWLLGGQVGYRAGGMRANVGLTYAHHDIDVTRDVRFPGFAETVSSSRGGSSRSIYGEVAYATNTGGLDLEPFAGASWQKVSLDAVNETGGLSALSIDKVGMSSTVTEVGIRFSAKLDEGYKGLYPIGTLAWQHRFGDRHADMTAALAGGNRFTIHGAALSRDALRANVGIGYRIGSAQLGLTYDGHLGGRDEDHAVRASLSVGF